MQTMNKPKTMNEDKIHTDMGSKKLCNTIYDIEPIFMICITQHYITDPTADWLQVTY